MLDGSSVLRQPAHRIVRKGVARTFQNIQLFRTMSVLENVLVGAHGRGRKAGEADALAMLDVVGLRDRALFPAAALPYGVQKRVELARALVAQPRLLLLDEPAGGLNHEEVSELGAFIRKIRDDFELTVLLVEHHMSLVMSISDHVNVLSFGRKIADGTARAGAGRSRRDRGVPRLGRRARGMKTLLELDAVAARYGPVQALRDVSLVVREGEVVAVLGANGAGKTTTLRAISGTVDRSGAIELDGKQIRAGPRPRRERASPTCPKGAARSSISRLPRTSSSVRTRGATAR